MLAESESVASNTSLTVTVIGNSPYSNPGTDNSTVQMSSPITLSPFRPLSFNSTDAGPPIEVMSAVTLTMLKSISETVTSR